MAGTVRQANKRGAARLAAVQALYQMDLVGADVNDVIGSFEAFWMGKEVEGETYLPADNQFFRDVVTGVLKHQARLDLAADAILTDAWPLKRIEAILRAVLRAGAFELFERPDVPGKAIIAEYVEIADAFVDRDEVGMVNAVLDRIARRVREEEFVPTAAPKS